MVRRAVHSVLRHLGPRDDLHILEPFTQRSDLRGLPLVLLKHERILARRAPGVPRLQQGLEFRAEPGDRARLPLFLTRERVEIELAVSRLLRFSRAFFCREALLFFPPALSLLYLLKCERDDTKGHSRRSREKKEKKNALLASASEWESHLDLPSRYEVALRLGAVHRPRSFSRAL